MTDVQAGDRVRATFTGTVEWDCSLRTSLQVRPDSPRSWAVALHAIDDIEVIKRAEPEYIHGAFYMGDDGVIYQHDDADLRWQDDKGWYKWGAERVPFSEPKRPLRRMRPEATEQDKASL